MANNSMASKLTFRDATRQQAKASILIEGLTGKGKSGLALLLGKYFADGDMQKVFDIDTENRSLDLFQGIQLSDGTPCTPFKKVDLTSTIGYQPSNYLACKENAIASGATVLINDSITHMWQREGGLLEMVTEVQKDRKYNNYTAWGAPTVKAEKDMIYQTVRDSRVHVISTVRVKEKFDMVTGSDNKTSLQSLGEQEMQMPDLKYEPDLVLQMVHAGTIGGRPPRAKVIKSRYAILTEGTEYDFTAALIEQLVAYLKEGTDPAELLERQRLDMIETIKEVLDTDASKRTMFPMLKEQQGFKDTKLVDLPLVALQTLLGIMLA